MKEQRGALVRKGELRKRGHNLGYSSRRNLDDRRHYDGGLFNYKRPERLSRDWERNCERREVSLIDRGREKGNNYERNQQETEEESITGYHRLWTREGRDQIIE